MVRRQDGSAISVVPATELADELGVIGHGAAPSALAELFADDNFDTEHPIYRAIADMTAVYHAEPWLRRGQQQVLLAEGEPGLFAITREYGDARYLAVFNFADETRESAIPQTGAGWQRLIGHGPKRALRRIELPGAGWAVYKSEQPACSVSNPDRP
jgi:glycosidase